MPGDWPALGLASHFKTNALRHVHHGSEFTWSRCADEIATCLGDERCTAILQCPEPLRCYEKPTPLEVNDCGLPCFRMIVGNSLPTDLIMMLLAIGACADQTCGTICHPQ